MARVTVESGKLRVELQSLHKVWALKNSFSVPLKHVRGATLDPDIMRGGKGLRAHGAHIPGIFVAGTFHKDGEKIFWDVRDPNKAIVIELREEPYARLVLEVEDPRGTVDLINRSAGQVTD